MNRMTMYRFLVLLLCGIFSVSVAGCGDRTDVRLDRAHVALDRGELETARDLALEVLQKRPDDRGALGVLAEARIGLNAFEEARKDVNRLLKLDDANADHRRLAVRWANASGQNLLEQVGFADSEALREEFEKTIAFGRKHIEWRLEHEPDEAQTHYDHGWLLNLQRTAFEMRREARQEAIAAMTEGDGDGSDDPMSRDELAEAAAEKRTQLTDALRKTLDRDPDHTSAARTYIAQLREAQRYEDLVAYLDEAAEREALPPAIAVAGVHALARMPEAAVDGDSMAVRIGRTEALLDTSAKEGRESPSWLIERARLDAMNQDWEESERYARRALDKRSDEPEARFLLAQALYEQNKHSEARRELNRVRERGPGVLLLSGRLYRQEGEPEMAVQDLGRAVRQNPGNREIRREWRRVLREMGQLDMVREESEQFYRNNPDMPAAIEEAFETRLLDDDRSAAIELLDRVAGIDPLTDEHRQILVRGNIQVRRLPEALKHAETLAERHPDNMRAQLTVATLLADMDRGDEARALTDQLVEQHPDADEPAQLLARLERREGRIDAAVERLHRVVEREPNNVEARIELAESMMQLALFQDAQNHLAAALEQEPDNGRAHELIARIHQMEGRDDQAAQHMARIDPDQLDPVRDALVLAGQRRRAGDHEGAMEAVREGIASGRSGQEPALRLMLAQMLAEQGDIGGAEEQLLRVARLAPTPYVFNHIVRFYSTPAAGGPQRGLDVLGELAEELPGQPMIDLARARFHAAEQNFGQAIPLARRALMAQMDGGQRSMLPTAVFTARLLAAADRWDEADAIFGSMIDAGLFESEATLQRIQLNHQRLGRERTVSDLQRFGRGLLADQFQLRQQVVAMLVALNEPGAAEDLLDRWLEQQPDDVRLIRLKAGLMMQARRVDAAAALLERAVELEPRNLRARSALAQVHMMRHDFPAAEAVFRDMGQIDSGAAIHGLSQLGAMFIELGLDKQAVATFQELEQVGRPYDPRILLSMGLAHSRLGQDEQAMQRLARVPSYAPQYALAQLTLARLESRHGRRDEARQRLQQLMERRDTAARAAAELARLNLDDPEGHAELVDWVDSRLELEGMPQQVRNSWQSLRISVADRRQDWDQLDRALADAQRENPDDLNVATSRIQVRMAQGRRDAAAQQFTDSRILQDSDRARRVAAIVGAAAPQMDHRESALIEYLIALAHGEPEEALSQIERFGHGPFYFRRDFRDLAERDDADANRTRDAAAMTLAAGYALDVGLPALASHLASEASERQPAMIPAYAADAQARSTLEWDKQPVLERIESRLPGTGLTLTLHAREAARDGDYDRAVEMIRRALDREPEHLRSRYALTQYLAAANHHDEAIEKLRELYDEQTPMHVAVSNDLAYLLAEHREGSLEEAAEIAHSAYEQRPSMPELIDTVAWITYKRGEHDQALRQLQRVAMALSDNREVKYHLGAAYEAAGNATWARYYLEEVAAGEADDPLTESARRRLEG